jgi:hypothetical protein
MAYSKQMWSDVRQKRGEGVPAPEIVAELQRAHGAVYTEQQLQVLVELVPLPGLTARHRWANRILVALLVIGSLSKLAFVSSLLAGAPGALLGLFAIVLNVGALVLVARYRRDGYLVTVMMAAMSVSGVARLAEHESPLALAIDLAYLVVIAALSFRQLRVLFPRLTWRGRVRSA